MQSLVVVLTDKADRTSQITPVITDLTRRVVNIKFSTSLPGGFNSCTLSILMTRSQAYEWYERFLFYGVTIFEADEAIWDGRISAIAITNSGIDLTCEGYWSSMADQTLYAWFNDNDMGKWLIPSAGAGGIANEISLAGAGAAAKDIVEKGLGMFRFGSKKNQTYVIGDKGVIYYRLPRVGVLTDRRLFQPMTIHSIQYSADVAGPGFAGFLKVYTADHPLGTWTHRLDINIYPSAAVVNLEANGADVEAGAVALDCTTECTEDDDGGVNRFLMKEVTIYAERDPTTTNKTTAKKIVTNLLYGDSDIDVTSHATQISDDQTFIEDSELEISPAVYEHQSLQDIIAALSSYGFDQSGVTKTVVAGVYGRRRLHMRARDETNVRWIVSLKNMGEGGLRFERTIQDFWVRTWVRYQEAFSSLTKLTDVAQNILEQTIFYDERDIVIEAGEMTATFADKVRDSALADATRPRQSTEITISGYITNIVGAREPLWRVRSGDMILIQDLSPMPQIIVGATADKLRTFVIKETDYNSTARELSITLDLPTTRLDLLLARLQNTPTISSPGSLSAGGGTMGGWGGGWGSWKG